MPTLYITEQGASLRLETGRLCVIKDGKPLTEVPLEQLEGLCIFGNIQLSTQLVAELLERGIETAFFTLNGRLKGQLTPAKARNNELRFDQFRLAGDENFSLTLAREITRAKIDNGLHLVKRYERSHPGEADFTAEVREMNNVLDGLSAVANRASLLGMEGTAARHYFAAFAKMLRQGWTFEGRKRRPPPDPVNALLSLGYVLVGSEIQSLLDGLGFDPYIGFFHTLEYGRPALALDLLEEYRAPLVDRFVLYLLNNRILKPEDFESAEEGGVRLTRAATKRFFLEYERHMNRPFRDPDYAGEQSFRTIFRQQAHRLANCLTKGEPYHPYTFDID